MATLQRPAYPRGTKVFAIPARKTYAGHHAAVDVVALPPLQDGDRLCCIAAPGQQPQGSTTDMLIYRVSAEGFALWSMGALPEEPKGIRVTTARKMVTSLADGGRPPYMVMGLLHPSNYWVLEERQRAAGLPTGRSVRGKSGPTVEGVQSGPGTTY